VNKKTSSWLIPVVFSPLEVVALRLESQAELDAASDSEPAAMMVHVDRDGYHIDRDF
jgi:hypothetical protein